jgi:phage-related minor tail protein
MQMLTGTKREITMMEWNEVLAKAEKKLADSKKCFELYGDEDSKRWIEEDQEKVDKIKQNIKEVIEFMDRHNIS